MVQRNLGSRVWLRELGENIDERYKKSNAQGLTQVGGMLKINGRVRHDACHRQRRYWRGRV